MAQQDTGMGWSAEGEWLVNLAGDVAGIQTFDDTNFPGQPVNVGSSAADFISGGYVVASYRYSGRTWNYRLLSGGDPIFIIGTNNSTQAYVCSPVQNAVFWKGQYRPETDEVRSITSYTCSSANSGWWYGVFSWGQDYQVSSTVPQFSDIATGIAALKAAYTSNPIAKDEDGYAVGCLARWYTQNGTELVSPVLISSNTDYTNMSMSGTGFNYAELNYLLSGVRFYMGFWDIPATATVSSPMISCDLRDKGNITLDQLFMYIVSTNYAHVIIRNSPDPYEEQSGSSKEEGGDGEDIVNDDVDFTPLPSSMAVASGFITLFCPSQYELNQLANYMWSPLFDVDTVKKLFANPMDCILGLSVYPFPISASGTKTVSVGGVSTSVSMGYTLQQYHIVDCGSVYVPKQWGAYMDYAPYTRFNIFLPYIGFRPVSADDIMGKTISLRYMIDILSGACNAELKCGSTVLYSWAGSCAAQIPITGNDWRSAITAGISIAGSVAATVLTQGASAPMIAGTIASATVNSTQLKPEVQRSGSISGSSGFLAGQRPYLVRTNPRSAIPANQNKYSGYPSFVTVLLGNLTGYNEVYSVHLENIPATGAELDEIESILKGGAIF